MNEYYIEWETDYCDDFPERMGECVINANTEQEAVKKFYSSKYAKYFKVIITRVEERKKQNA